MEGECHAVIQYFDAQAPSFGLNPKSDAPVTPMAQLWNAGASSGRTSKLSTLIGSAQLLDALTVPKDLSAPITGGGARPRASLFLCADEVKTEISPR